MESKTIAIIGAGVMGCATALHIAGYGYRAILKDISYAALDKVRK